MTFCIPFCKQVAMQCCASLHWPMWFRHMDPSLDLSLPIYISPFLLCSCLSLLIAWGLVVEFNSRFYYRDLKLGGIKSTLAIIFIFSLPWGDHLFCSCHQERFSTRWEKTGQGSGELQGAFAFWHAAGSREAKHDGIAMLHPRSQHTEVALEHCMLHECSSQSWERILPYEVAVALVICWKL